MSRTIRKSKGGSKYPDGQGRKLGFYCGCYLCTGNSYEEIQKKKEKVADTQIKEEVRTEFWWDWEDMDGSESWEEWDLAFEQEMENWEWYKNSQAA